MYSPQAKAAFAQTRQAVAIATAVMQLNGHTAQHAHLAALALVTDKQTARAAATALHAVGAYLADGPQAMCDLYGTASYARCACNAAAQGNYASVAHYAQGTLGQAKRWGGYTA